MVIKAYCRILLVTIIYFVMLLFSSIEKVNVKLKVPGKKLEHHGIKIEFVGQIGRQSLCVLFCYTDATLCDYF